MKTNSFGCLVALALLLTAPLAAGKGITFSIRASPDTPKVGELVQITVHGVSEIPGERIPACAGMRVLAVSPSVSVKEALRVVEGGGSPGRSGPGGPFGSPPCGASTTRPGSLASARIWQGAGPS